MTMTLFAARRWRTALLMAAPAVTTVVTTVQAFPDLKWRAPHDWQATVSILDPANPGDNAMLKELDVKTPAEQATGMSQPWRQDSDKVYRLEMQWRHSNNITISTPTSGAGAVRGANTGDKWFEGVCALDSDMTYWDSGLQRKRQYWEPVFLPAQVSDRVTKITGMQFASVDWQPCGHKEIVICHAESHYDFHMYYIPLEEANQQPCAYPNPFCPYNLEGKHNRSEEAVGKFATGVPSAAEVEQNAKFFRLMKGNNPLSSTKVVTAAAGGQPSAGATHNFKYCVDRTSGIINSGVHFGDKSETLEEWKKPVGILGGYDCGLAFYEPMFSAKWLSGGVAGAVAAGEWPKFDTGLLDYADKRLWPLPRRWSVEAVSDSGTEGCKTIQNADYAFDARKAGASGKETGVGPCQVKVVVYGKACDEVLGCGVAPDASNPNNPAAALEHRRKYGDSVNTIYPEGRQCQQWTECKTDELFGFEDSVAGKKASATLATTASGGDSGGTEIGGGDGQNNDTDNAEKSGAALRHDSSGLWSRAIAVALLAALAGAGW